MAVKYSDAVIKRYLSDLDIYQLKDLRYPLRLRFHSDRINASWFVIKYAKGRTVWRKLGNWPSLDTKAILRILPDVLAKLALDLDNKDLSSSFYSLKELLTWYKDRSLSDRNLSHVRKNAIKSAITRHLLPILGDFPIKGINHAVLDERLFWPLQSKYTLSYVRSLWVVLKQTFKRANKLNIIESDPVSSYQFRDFIEAPILPKPCAIRSDEIAALLSNLRPLNSNQLILILMMLLHGTRIGETRQARWDHVSFSERRWFIPANHTKTNKEHILPLTDHAVSLLRGHREQQRENGYDGVNLFPNTTKRNPINQKQATSFIQSASGGQWQSHDLRKVARTLWMDIGVDYMVGELLLNHAMTRLDQTYIHTFAETQKRQALEQYHEWLNIQGLFFFLKSGSETVTRPRDLSIP